MYLQRARSLNGRAFVEPDHLTHFTIFVVQTEQLDRCVCVLACCPLDHIYA